MATLNPFVNPARIRRGMNNGPVDTRRMQRTARLRATQRLGPVARMNRQFQRLAGMGGG